MIYGEVLSITKTKYGRFARVKVTIPYGTPLMRFFDVPMRKGDFIIGESVSISVEHGRPQRQPVMEIEADRITQTEPRKSLTDWVVSRIVGI